jgi:mitotic-spindle organizing protein 1
MSTRESERNSSAQQTLDSRPKFLFVCYPLKIFPVVLYDISQLLNTQLDKATLATCVGMVENGVNPEALAVCLTNYS